MKFGKRLLREQYPAWVEQYVSYKVRAPRESSSTTMHWNIGFCAQPQLLRAAVAPQQPAGPAAEAGAPLCGVCGQYAERARTH